MKLIPFLIIMAFSPAVPAITLEKVQPSLIGTNRQVFHLSPDKRRFENQTQVFTANSKEYFSGEYVLQGKDKELAVFNRKLEEILKKLKGADQVLKGEGKSFNELSQGKEHSSEIILEGFRIPENREDYKTLSEIFYGLSGLKWKLWNGFKLNSDLSQVTVYRNGKAEAPKKYHTDVYCRETSQTSICTYMNSGSVWIKR
jgi:hypothetical protein